MHPDIRASGTETGRLSAADPPIHNIPWRSVIKKMFCSRFQDGLILVQDFSQAELRVFSVLAKDASMMQAFHDGRDIHTFVAARCYNKKEADVTVEERKKAKSYTFALLYGATAHRIATETGMSEDEAERMVQVYMDTFPGVKRYFETQEKMYKKLGYVDTPFGRKRPLGLFKPSDALRRAVNSPIQSSASDITLHALTRVWKRLQEAAYRSRVLISVHDSILVDVYPGELFEILPILYEEMAEAPVRLYSWLTVPMRVDTEIGGTWGHLFHLAWTLEDTGGVLRLSCPADVFGEYWLRLKPGLLAQGSMEIIHTQEEDQGGDRIMRVEVYCDRSRELASVF